MNYENKSNDPARNGSEYGDGNTPEIDTSKSKADATNVIPDEVPRRDGPGGN